jgi:hypothetical protein
MTLFFRMVRLIALAAWTGALFYFGFIAKVAFQSFDAANAGTMVRGSLLALHHLGFYAGVIYLLLTVALLATQRDSHPARAIELVLIISMLALTVYSQLSVIPRMETDRINLGGDVTKVSAADPTAIHFQRLHGLSVKLEGAVLVEAIILLALAPIHGREDFDRFA